MRDLLLMRALDIDALVIVSSSLARRFS